jgi:hypothetical protein
MTTLAGLSLVSALPEGVRRRAVAAAQAAQDRHRCGPDRVRHPDAVGGRLRAELLPVPPHVPRADGGWRLPIRSRRQPGRRSDASGSRVGACKARPYGCASCPGGQEGGRGPCVDRGPQGREGGRRAMQSRVGNLAAPPVKKTHARPSGGTGTAWAILVQRRQHGAPLRCIRYEPLWRHAANLARGENVNDGEDGARFGS